jgi:DNA repair exonuclease SbcCD ATPase subunit
MAVQVRVQNFQSIEDASVTIDGLTVVTGANHSGKTAFMRAIRGVFTNAPPGPLVRHGCAHLSVSLVFDDGTSVLWEKGWEKPGRKGKTINRYTVNGKQIATVGRGVPPEVEGLGVREISAASDRVWPQIAQQFDGTLFLVNRPGSAIAEALSDVKRVGALSAALKASEKDRRSANAELKIRRKDIESHKVSAERFDGLDPVADQIRLLVNDLAGIQAKGEEINEITRLRAGLESATQAAQDLDGFASVSIPETKAPKIKQAITKVGGYAARLHKAREAHRKLQGFGEVSLPESVGPAAAKKQRAEVADLRERHVTATGNVGSLESTLASTVTQLAEAEAEVKRLLGDRGECPTCNTIHEGAHP